MFQTLSRTFSIDLRALALFRIGLSVVFICDLFNRCLFLRDHYTKEGLLPLKAWYTKFYNVYYYSLNFVNDTVFFQSLLFLVSFCCAICLLFGYRSKLAAFLCWILLTSLQNRNIMLLQAGDTLLRMLFFWSMFLPLGAVASVDAAMRKSDCDKKEINNAASFAILFQVAVLYLMTALLKTSPEWWPNFTAGLKALYIEQFTTRFGLFLREFELLTKGGTAFVFVLELLAFLLILCPIWPIRFVGIAALMGMHICFALSMRLGLFPFTDILSLLIFIPKPVWDFLEAKVLTKRSQAIAFYDGECGFCLKLVKIICYLLFIPDLQIKEAQSDEKACELMLRNNSWVFRTDTGENLQEFEGIIALVSLSPYFRFFAPILRIFFIKWLGTGAYRIVANNRGFFGKISSKLLTEMPNIKLNPGKFTSIVILFLTSLCLLWNLSFLSQVELSFPKAFKPLMVSLRLSQRWNMFSPQPPSTSGWYVIPGTLVDGSEVNVWTLEEEAASFDKPDLVSETFISQRWRKYLMKIWLKKHKDYRLYFGKYLCRRWNRGVAEHSRKLKQFKIYFMKQKIVDSSSLASPEPVVIWSHHCFGRSKTLKQ